MYFGMARIAERNGKLESAKKAYQRILEQDPEHVDSLHRLAVISVQKERLEEAFDYFEHAIRLTEPNAELLGDYGYALYLGEEFEAAESALMKSQELSPDNPRVANNLALVLGRQGKYTEAYELFQLTGDQAEAIANLAYVQSQAGDISYAKENYHQALGIDPTLSVAANGLYEIHQAFPRTDSMLIKPFRGDPNSSPKQLAQGSVDADMADQLIRSISIQNNPTSRSPSVGQPVTRATYHAPVDHYPNQHETAVSKGPRLPPLKIDRLRSRRRSPAAGLAEPTQPTRNPNQSRASFRSVDSSSRSIDSSRK